MKWQGLTAGVPSGRSRAVRKLAARYQVDEKLPSHREQPRKTHYIIAPSPVSKDTPTESVIGQAVVEVFAASYQQLGVVPLWFDEYTDIPDIVDSIRDLSQ